MKMSEYKGLPLEESVMWAFFDELMKSCQSMWVVIITVNPRTFFSGFDAGIHLSRPSLWAETRTQQELMYRM